MSNSSFNPIFNYAQAGAGLTLSNGTIAVITNYVGNTVFRQSAASSLVGNSAGTTGNVADITLGTGLTFTGTTLAIGTSGVTAGTYGNGTNKVAQVVVDAVGRITSASTLSISFDGNAFVNKFRNATFDIWQRGTTGGAITPSTVTYTADGWILHSVTAGVSWSQGTGRLPTSNSLKITGVSGVTQNPAIAWQRIESNVVGGAFDSVSITWQAKIFNSTGADFTPMLYVGAGTAAGDTTGYPSVVLGTTNLQLCPNGVWTQVAYTLTGVGTMHHGCEFIAYAPGSALDSGTKSINVTELDVRATPGVTTGLNSSPPTPELRPIQTELAFCQRYLPAFNSTVANQPISSGMCISTTAARTLFQFPVNARIAPTGITASGTGNFAVYNSAASLTNITAMSFNKSSTTSGLLAITVASGLVAGNATTLMTGTSVSTSQILFTGAEL